MRVRRDIMVSKQTDDEDRAGEGYGGYRQDPLWSGGLYISPELAAVKNFAAPNKTLKSFVQDLLDTWARQQCEVFSLTPRNPHSYSPKLDKPGEVR